MLLTFISKLKTKLLEGNMKTVLMIENDKTHLVCIRSFWV